MFRLRLRLKSVKPDDMFWAMLLRRRARLMDTIQDGDRDGENKQREILRRDVESFAVQAVLDHDFGAIEMLGRVLRTGDFKLKKGISPAHEEIGLAIADYFDSNDALPPTQKELFSYLAMRGAPHSKSTVNSALENLGNR